MIFASISIKLSQIKDQHKWNIEVWFKGIKAVKFSIYLAQIEFSKKVILKIKKIHALNRLLFLWNGLRC